MADFESATGLEGSFASKRFPHSKSRQKGRAGNGKQSTNSTGGVFNPLRALGYYEVRLGTSIKRINKSVHVASESGVPSWLEIHELTRKENGLIGTFSFTPIAQNTLEGMCVLTGNRKVMAEIIEDLNGSNGLLPEDDLSDVSRDVIEIEIEIGNENENESHILHHMSRQQHQQKKQQIPDKTRKLNPEGDEALEEETEDEDEDEDKEDEDEDEDKETQQQEQSSLEISDAKLNRRFRAFEKNSFRNPKFWFRWNDARNGSDTTTPTVTGDKDQGYLVFSSNVCDKFEGTISCSRLSWNNLRIVGWKTRSKARSCPLSWTEVDR